VPITSRRQLQGISSSAAKEDSNFVLAQPRLFIRPATIGRGSHGVKLGVPTWTRTDFTCNGLKAGAIALVAMTIRAELALRRTRQRTRPNSRSSPGSASRVIRKVLVVSTAPRVADRADLGTRTRAREVRISQACGSDTGCQRVAASRVWPPSGGEGVISRVQPTRRRAPTGKVSTIRSAVRVLVWGSMGGRFESCLPDGRAI
jgi:hypothetical protein